MDARTISRNPAPATDATALVIAGHEVFEGPGRWSHSPVVHALVRSQAPFLNDTQLALPLWQDASEVLRQCLEATPLAVNAPLPSGDGISSVPAVCATLSAQILLRTGWSLHDVIVVPAGDQEFHLISEYQDPEMTTRAMALSLQIVNQVLAGDVQSQELAEVFRSLCVDFGEMGSIDRYIYQARERGIPVRRFGTDERAIELGTGKYIKRTIGQMSAACSVTGVQNAGDKSLTNKLLSDRGLPVPRSIEATNVKQAVAAAKRIGFPVVLKPLSGNHGRGVCINLKTPEEIEKFFPVASSVARSGVVVVETFLEGKDYRILVIDDKIAGVTERVPAAVTGDGVHDIRDLIDLTNAEPNRGKPFENILNLITIDDLVIDTLNRQGLTLADIPAEGQVVNVRQTANISTGGSSIDRTDEIHPDNAMVARMAAKTIGLQMAGVDIIMPDIGRSVWETGGGIAEVNSGPGFRLHNRPFRGQPRNVVGAVLDMYYPAGTPFRVPVIAVLAGDGVLADQVADLLESGDRRVGLARPGKVTINGVSVNTATAGNARGAMVLRNAATEIAVIQVVDDDLEYPGLPFEQVDVLVLGPGRTAAPATEAILQKVLEPHGTIVISSGDDKAGDFVERFRSQTLMVGEKTPLMEGHIAAGGKALSFRAVADGDELTMHDASGATVIEGMVDGELAPLAKAVALAATWDTKTPAGVGH